MIVNRTKLAEIFGVSLTSVDNWIRRDCPYIQKAEQGKPWKFETKEVSDWLRKQDIIKATEGVDNTDIDEAKRRKLVADATLSEIAVAKEKGIVIDAEEIKNKLSSVLAEFTSKVRRIPERAVLRVVGETNESRIKSILLEEIDECLNLFIDYVDESRL